jgi:hypothetical protein
MRLQLILAFKRGNIAARVPHKHQPAICTKQSNQVTSATNFFNACIHCRYVGIRKLRNWNKLVEGRAMAQAVSRRPPTSEAWVRSRVSPCGICGGQSGTGTGFSPISSVLTCQFHSTGAPLLWKGQKIIIIIVIFITGVHKKPQGCGASVASAAGLSPLKKNSYKITRCRGTAP